MFHKRTHFFFSAGISFLLIAGIVLYLMGYRPFIVLSGSMEPAIPTGSVIFTDTHSTSPSLQEIVTFQMQNTIISHRMIGFSENKTYITKGDANSHADPMPLPQEKIIGICRFHLPYLGYLLIFLRKRPWIMLLLPALWIVTDQVRKEKKYEIKS